MKTRLVSIVLVLVLGFVSLVYAADDPPKKANPREKLETIIPEGIRLLKAKKYKTFLEQFVAPEDLKRIKSRVKLEDMAELFGKRKAGVLLSVLESIKDQEPEVSDDGKTATYRLSKPAGSKKKIEFQKVGKYWYIKN